jgi:hypothetical protein
MDVEVTTAVVVPRQGIEYAIFPCTIFYASLSFNKMDAYL